MDVSEEEGMRPKVKKTPPMPSINEVEEHMVTHIPFRDWCAHCVRGNSKSDPHHKSARDINEVPEVSLDYMYMESGSHEEQLGMPTLVVRDRKTGWYMAGVVPTKGEMLSCSAPDWRHAGSARVQEVHHEV